MDEFKKKRALVLTSDGLDSILTMYILKYQGIDVVGIHMVTWFNIPKFTLLEDQPEFYTYHGFKIYNVDVSEEYIPILLNPKYGYGTSVNPCIDCKILFFKKAKEYLDKFNADFVATGEVIGQRPMTQNKRAMKLIEEKSGLKGLLLRPLSAKLLEPTIIEEKGWVNREELYDISGRNRKRQLELAREFGIKDYPSPAGGCILTEKNFKPRFDDLIKHTDNISVIDFLTLRYGRHFRISKGSHLIVGKNFEENEFLKRLKWGNIRLDLINIPGPYCLFKWDGRISTFKLALQICLKYSSHEKKNVKSVLIKATKNRGKVKELLVKPKVNLDVSEYIVC